MSSVKFPRLPGPVSWLGVGFAVGAILYAAAKRKIKGEKNRKTKPAAKGSHAPKEDPRSGPESKSSAADAGTTKTASPPGKEKVKAPGTAATKGKATTPRKRTTKKKT